MIYSRWSLQANISLLMRTWLLSTRQALFLENTRSLMISRYDRDGSFASIPSTIHNATIWWRSRVFLFVLLVAWISKNDWCSKNGSPMDWSTGVNGPGGGKTKRRKPPILLCSHECSDDVLFSEFATRALHSLLTGECCCIPISRSVVASQSREARHTMRTSYLHLTGDVIASSLLTFKEIRK